MWVKASLAIALAAALCVPAAAGERAFPQLTDGFWRPAWPNVPDLLIRVKGNEIHVITACFEKGRLRGLDEGKAIIGGAFETMENPQAKCAPSRSGFDAFNLVLDRAAQMRSTEAGIVLQSDTGRDIVAMAPFPPDGIEYRRMTVKAFRGGKEYLNFKDAPDDLPDLVLYNGHIEGSPGCGMATGSYDKRSSTSYKFDLGYIVAGACADRALRLSGELCEAFNGVRDVEVRGEDFILRDMHGRIQVVLSPFPEGEKP
jgi:hypothetical protein